MLCLDGCGALGELKRRFRRNDYFNVVWNVNPSCLT